MTPMEKIADQTPEIGTLRELNPWDARTIREGDDNAMTRFINEADKPLPYGHARLPSGDVVDLTAIEKPFGLLPPDVQEALLDHGGPYDVYTTHSGWTEPKMGRMSGLTYRVRPQPTEPKVEVVAVYLGRCTHGVDAKVTLTVRDGVPDPDAKVEPLK